VSNGFDYVAVLVSIISGLALTRLSGLSEMIQSANRARIYGIHVVWMTLVLEVMLSWWVLYRWRDYYYKNRRGFFFIFGAIAPLDTSGRTRWQSRRSVCHCPRNRRGLSYNFLIS
jgi:hypothetical protein